MFVAVNHISPQADWLLLPFLVFELIVFTFAVGLVLATMFVRLRDVGQVWDLVVQLLFFASPIIYPVGFLPPWAKPIAFVSPVVQVMQDVRAVIIGGPAGDHRLRYLRTGWAYLVPLGFCVLTLVFALWLFHRESPWFAERI